MAIRVLQGSRISFAPRPEDIPELRTRIPEQRFIPTSSVSATALGTLGSTIVQTGEVLGRVGAIDQARDENREANALELNLKNRLFELQYGSADGTTKGFANERGQEFLNPKNKTLYDSNVQRAITDAWAQSTSGSPRVRQEFQRVAAQLQFSQNVTRAAQGVQERHAAEIATDGAFVDTYVRDIIASRINGVIARGSKGSLSPADELVRQQHLNDLAGIAARTDQLADRLGIPRGKRGAAERALMRQDALTRAHKGVIDRFLANGQADEAKQYYNVFTAQIAPQIRGDIEKSILSGAVLEDARTIIDAPSVKLQPTRALRMAAVERESKGFSAATRKEALASQRLREGEITAAEKETDDTLVEKFNRIVQSGGDPSSLSNAEIQRLQEMGHWREGLKTATDIRANKDVGPDQGAYLKAWNMIRNDPAKFGKENLHTPAAQKLYGNKWEELVAQQQVILGKEEKVNRQDTATRKKSKNMPAILTAGKSLIDDANMSKGEFAIFMEGLSLELARVPEDVELDQAKRFAMVKNALEKVTLTGTGIIWEDVVTQAAARAAGKTDIAVLKEYDTFIKDVVQFTGLPNSRVLEIAAAITAQDPGRGLTAITIMAEHKRQLRITTKARVDAAIRKGAPRPPVTPRRPVDPVAAIELQKLLAREAAKGLVDSLDPGALAKNDLLLSHKFFPLIAI